MARVPFVGRLSPWEYIVLFISFLFLTLEFVIRAITLALPSPILNFFYNRSRAVFKLLPSSRRSKVDRKSQKPIVRQIREANGFVEMCALFEYEAEEHIVQTKDGYLLGLHRIPRGRDEKAPKRGEKEKKRRGVVYLHHGLLMNSEVWVCNLEPHKCLPFVLADKGFDVWLGNNRGNKYSKKSIYANSQDLSFWNFSMDEFAMHDIPDSIEYILAATKSRSLSYIGFSQGTAQAFATLSIHPDLNEVVDVFIALAPAMSPAGLHNTIVDALVKSSPDIIFLFFGRKSILSSTIIWQSILYPPIFVRIIDRSLAFLFNWTGRNISLQQKLAAYSHLYSFTSVKSVVHWFQIMREGSFQFYDDEPVGWGLGRSFYYKVAKFPTRNIKTPIVLVYGGSDSLVDINSMLAELPNHTEAKEIPHYEHIDFLWGEDVDKLVIPHVLESLENYSASAGRGDLIKDKQVTTKTTRFALKGLEPPTYSEDERISGSGDGATRGETSSRMGGDGASELSEQSESEPRSTTSGEETSTPSRTQSKAIKNRVKTSNPPSPPTSSTVTPTGTQSPWPTWLGGRRGGKPDTLPNNNNSVNSPTTNPLFAADGLKIGAGKPAQGAVITNPLGEGEELEGASGRRRRKNDAKAVR